MKKIIFFIVFTILCWQHALAQVATNGGSGLATTYTSLSDAITALNAATISSPVVITLTGNETAPAGGYNITATGTSVNTITIEGSSSTITAPTNHTVGNFFDALFKIKGGDFITIQNFTMIENASNTITTFNDNNMTEFGVALFYATTTNGAQNCTIQNNTITLNRTYYNTFGIYSSSIHDDTYPSPTSTATSTAGSNSGLKIYGNAISNVNLGIVVVGPTGAADHNTGIDIGGSASANGNTITNFGTGGSGFAFYAYSIQPNVHGVLVKNSTGFNVSYNTITSNGGVVEAFWLEGITIASATNPPTGTFTNTINNNTIALTHGSTGTIHGIKVESSTGTATSTQHINNNNFTALGRSATANGTVIAISNAMPNLVNNFNGNTFTNITTNESGSFTFFSHSYTMPAGGYQTFNGNSIVTAFSKTGAGGIVTIAAGAGSSPNGTFHTFTNNNFSNITVTGATGIRGVNNTDGTSSSSATRTVTGNTFSNWTGGTGAITGISYSRIGGTTSTISNNSLTNITGQGAITGITISTSTSLATTFNLANNTISNLTSTGTGGAVTGLACTNASPTININGNAINTLSSTGASAVTALSIGGGATTNCFQNKIYNVSGANASSTVNGILISAGLNINTYNNLIGDLKATAASGTDVIRGISITSTTALSTHKIYGNTIYLNAASSGVNFGGSGIYHTVSGTSTTSALDLQNNIIINGLTPRGTGLAVAFRRSAGAATNLANYAATSNKNLFYAGTPGASNLIYSDGTSSAQTMANYQAGVFTAGTVAPRDANSFTEAWTSSNFVSVIGSSTNYLQPASGFITQAESGGNTIALISPDYNNVVRPGLGGTGYDIGAWEFSEQGQTQGLTVTYDSQNGSAIANGSTTSGGSIASSPGTPTRAGFTFNGWFTASSGGSAISFPYTHGQTANFTLYAQWTATYMITVTAGLGGSISPVTSLVNAGSNNTYTITPAAGYLISDVTVDGTSAAALTTGNYAAGGTYVFTDVQANHTISVTFALACSNVGLASATATASPICANATTTLTYSGLTGTNATVTWTQNADGTGTTYGTGTPSSAVGPGTYYAYATGDCGSAVYVQVVVAASPLVMYYADADGDHYYTGVAVPSCTSPGTGYTTSGILGGGDCDDNNAAVNPGANEICYNGIDDNCNGTVNEGCETFAVNMISTSVTLTTFVNAVAAFSYSLSPYTNLKYRFIITKIQAGQPNEVQEFTNPTRHVIIPLSMRSYTATYTIRAAAVINDEVLAYLGNTMTITPPPVALITLSSFSCGATLGSLNAPISAVSGLNATGYIFRIRKATGTSAVTGPFFTSSSSTRFIGANTFTGLPLEYSGAYKVSVAYTYLDPSDNSTLTTAYGAECDLFTLTIPTINLVAPTCGTVQLPAAVSSMTATVAAARTVGATGYQFRIRQTGGATYFTTAILPSRFTQLSLFGTALSFGTNYSISVQFYSPIDGVSTASGYGSECHITTPVFPTTQLVQTLCGNSYTLTQQLNIVPYPGFPRYRVKLSQPDPQNPEGELVIATKEVDYSYFKMSDFPEVQVGETYFIEVAIEINGVFGDYGNSCEISVVAPSIAKAVIVPFKATAYPNPFADNFMLDVKTTSQSIVNVKVYDMVGRIIEQRELRTSDLETTTIGNNYPSGVYNVVVAQEDNVQTVRVVKR